MKDSMSLWGIGPVFLICIVITVAGFTALSLFFNLMFNIIFCIPLFYAAGVFLFVSGLCLWIPAGKSIDDCIRMGILADKGVYGIVRNPIYTGMLFVTAGICVALHTLFLFIPPVICYFSLLYLLRNEDKVLQNAFGDEYDDYKKRVNRFWPNPKAVLSSFFYPEHSSIIDEKVWIIKDGDVNIFVIHDGSKYICIDSGYSSKRLRGLFEDAGIRSDFVSAVFLTHTDRDHSGGLDLIPDAEVFIGREESRMIDGKTFRFFPYRNKALKRSYNVVDDGQTVLIGSIKVRALATPGHTSGHTAWVVNDRYLFSGDSVIRQNGKIRPFYSLFNMNNRQAVLSAKRIKVFIEANASLALKYVCTAHTGVIVV